MPGIILVEWRANCRSWEGGRDWMKTWGEYYHAIASRMALFRESNRHLAEVSDLQPGMTVVDLACGSGLTALAALDRVPDGLKLYLVDASASMVDAARANVGGRAHAYMVGDAEQVAGLVPEKADRLLCNLSFGQFRNPDRVLAAIRPLLKPTGRLCFTLSGTYFNTGGDVVSPQWALIHLLHRQGLLPRGLPAVDRLPNQRSVEGTLTDAGFKPFHCAVHEITSSVPETEPGGELHNLVRLQPPLPGDDLQTAVHRTLALLPDLASALTELHPRWRVVSFMAQPALTPEEMLRSKFGERFPS